MMDNCKNCGAPPKSTACCEYCGTMVHFDSQTFIYDPTVFKRDNVNNTATGAMLSARHSTLKSSRLNDVVHELAIAQARTPFNMGAIISAGIMALRPKRLI